MEILLVRHAIAEEADRSRWPDDRDRPLTSRGMKRFREAAHRLGELVPSVDVVLSSRFVRAWQTAKILEESAGWPGPRECEALENGAPAEALHALQPFTASSSVALVGHEPYIHELTSYLLTADTGHAQVEFKKGGVARLVIDESLRPGSAQLLWLLSPKVLRNLNVARGAPPGST